MPKNKQPKTKHEPFTSKQPRIGENPESYLRLNPSWRIGKMEFVDPFGWHMVDAATLAYVRERLSALETMTWDEVLVRGQKFNHNVDTGRLSKRAQDRLVALRLDELDELLSLCLSGVERVWGILDRGVVSILWWDPDHKVCPSLLKHT